MISSRPCCSKRPMLIAVMLILGGIVLLVIDRIAPAAGAYDDALALPLRQGAGHRALSNVWR